MFMSVYIYIFAMVGITRRKVINLYGWKFYISLCNCLYIKCTLVHGISRLFCFIDMHFEAILTILSWFNLLAVLCSVHFALMIARAAWFEGLQAEDLGKLHSRMRSKSMSGSLRELVEWEQSSARSTNSLTRVGPSRVSKMGYTHSCSCRLQLDYMKYMQTAR